MCVCAYFFLSESKFSELKNLLNCRTQVTAVEQLLQVSGSPANMFAGLPDTQGRLANMFSGLPDVQGSSPTY